MGRRYKAYKGVILDENFPRPACPTCKAECKALIMDTNDFLQAIKMTYEELETAIAEGNEERIKWFIQYMDFDHREVAIFACDKCIKFVYTDIKKTK